MENQLWFCDFCKRKYSLKRKEKHLQTEVHKKNEERLNLRSDYEFYRLIRQKGLFGDQRYISFLGFKSLREFHREFYND